MNANEFPFWDNEVLLCSILHTRRNVLTVFVFGKTSFSSKCCSVGSLQYNVKKNTTETDNCVTTISGTLLAE